MLQRRGDADLREEPLGADGRGDLVAQHLDRDAAVVPQVAREIHGGHAAARDLALDRRSGPRARARAARRAGGASRHAEHLGGGSLEEVVAGIDRARRAATSTSRRSASSSPHASATKASRRAGSQASAAWRMASTARHRSGVIGGVRAAVARRSVGVVTPRARGAATCARRPTRDRPSRARRRAPPPPRGCSGRRSSAARRAAPCADRCAASRASASSSASTSTSSARRRRRDVASPRVTCVPRAAALERAARARVIDEHAPHHLRGDGEELRAALPARVVLAVEPQPRLVHERGGLEGVPLALAAQRARAPAGAAPRTRAARAPRGARASPAPHARSSSVTACAC